MTRRIIQLAGDRAQFALDDSGDIWLWTDGGWKDASRGPLPDKPGVDYYAPEPTRMTAREFVAARPSDLAAIMQAGQDASHTLPDASYAFEASPEPMVITPATRGRRRRKP